MSLGSKKTEGGQGGKRGHSNMVHYTGTEDVKYRTKRKRRIEDRDVSRPVGRMFEMDERVRTAGDSLDHH